jgi:hypothetical protein
MGDDCCDIPSGVEVLAELLVLFGLFLDHVEYQQDSPSLTAAAQAVA